MTTAQKGFSIVAVVAVVAVLAIGGGVYYATQSDVSETTAETQESVMDNEENTATATDEEASGEVAMSGTGSLKTLLNRNESVRCEVTRSGEATQVDGVLYATADGSQFRWDFTATQQGEEIETHVIRDGDTQYMWSSRMNQGMKMTVDPETLSADTAAQGQGNAAVDYNREVDYDCESWSVDESQLEPPTDINFRSFGGVGAGAGAQY